MSTATSLMSFAEFEQLPDVPGKQELVGGEYIHMPPPEKDHSTICIRVTALLLNGPFRERVRGDNTGYRIGGGWIVPDASILQAGQAEDEKYYLGAPMLAVEVLSPGEEIETKLDLYFAEGAREVWVVNTRRKSLAVYLRRGSDIVRLAVDRQYTSEAAGVTVSLEELFG
jgi:Uma2 family endonuclease